MAAQMPLDAYLVVDNSFLVMLTEFFCETQAQGLPGSEVIPALSNSICKQLHTITGLAPDGNIYCSERVLREYKPWNGRLSTMSYVPFAEKQKLAQHVAVQFEVVAVKDVDIQILRHQPDAPRRLVGSGGLSNEDLSLVAVGVQLCSKGVTYVLSNDQDLLEFISWLRRKPEARELWSTIDRLQALHCLTYLELVHRSCRLSTSVIRDLITFALREHYSRTELSGTTKGTNIFEGLLRVQDSLMQSVAIKMQKTGAIA